MTTTLSNGAYFELHPGKILGEVLTHSPKSGKLLTDQFGNAKPEVRGNLSESLKRIKAKSVLPFDHSKDSVVKVELEDEAVKKALIITKKTVSPRVKKEKLVSLDESIKFYNPGLSEEEIKVWITYQVQRKVYSREIIQKNAWGKYLVEDPDYIEWLRQGLVVFSGKEGFLPSPIFFSENIYHRIRDFKRHKPQIIEVTGEAHYNETLERLEEAKPVQLRFTAADDPESKLIISPFDRFLKDFEISELANGKDFRGMALPVVEAFARYWLDDLTPESFIDGTIRSSAYDIRNYWIGNRRFPNGTEEIEKTTIKKNSSHIGKLLFNRFLFEGITRDDQVNIEATWNSKFNSIKDFDASLVPVGFEISTLFKGGPLKVRPPQREGVAFLSKSGTGIIAYDVGVGKTMTGILALEDGFKKGLFKRPLLVVPNPTYKKWIGETVGVRAEKDIKENGKLKHKKGNLIAEGILPQYPVNDYYNLGTSVIDRAQDSRGNTLTVPEYSITFITYEGLMKLGFDEAVEADLVDSIKAILGQADGMPAREAALLEQAIYDKIDKALEGSKLDIGVMGIDAILVDEAHNFKNLFASVKGEMEGDDSGDRSKSPYLVTGAVSNRAIKLFMICRYIQLKNGLRNTFGLTATPFTNSPLEIFSMLSHFDYQGIKRQGLEGLKSFFDKFVNETIEPTWTAKGTFEAKPVIRSFNNLPILQDLIFRAIIYKTGEEANITRPIKVVIPLRKDHDGIEIGQQYKIPAELSPSPAQQHWFKELAGFAGNQETSVAKYYPTAKDPKMNGRVMWSISMAQNATLSPLLTPFAFDAEVTPEKFIATSPKFTYVVECIRTIKKYHETLGEQSSGIVIYSNRGTSFFPLIREYLINNVGFSQAEVQIIDGKTTAAKKERIKTGFLEGDVTVIIGSATIEEGIDLQKRATVLFNCYLQWNPTQLKQLEGRIWRFGNKYSHVRIVIPLIENSVDILMWQKLSEKTDRINNIWQRAGRNTVLNLDELNPEELKYALITDPLELAKMEVKESLLEVETEKELVKGYIKQLGNAKLEIAQILEKENNLRQIAVQARDINNYPNWLKDREDIQAKIEELPIDPSDIRSIYKIVRAFARMLEKAGQTYKRVTMLQQVEYHIKSKDVLLRLEKNVLEKNGLTLQDNLEPVIEKYQAQLDKLTGRIDEITSQGNLEAILNRVTREIEERKLQSGTIDDRVDAFARLNFLLECNANSGNTCSIYGINRGGKPKPELPIQKKVIPIKPSTEAKGKITSKSPKKKISNTSNNAFTASKKKVKDMNALVYEVMPKHQQVLVKYHMDKQASGQVVKGIEENIKDLPIDKRQKVKVYREEAIVHMHYFYGESDWFITEYHRDDGRFFGYAILNGDDQMSELGYVSLQEIVNSKVELDFHYKPRPLAQALFETNPKYYPDPNTKPEEAITVEDDITEDQELAAIELELLALELELLEI